MKEEPPVSTTHAFAGRTPAENSPAAMASLVCFALNAGLLVYIYRMERR